MTNTLKQLMKPPIQDKESLFNYIINISKETNPTLDKWVIKNKPTQIVRYAIVKNKKWPQAEPLIKKNPGHSYMYAKYIIKDKWPPGEQLILKYPELACQYAIDVIKTRWPQAEKTISKDSYWYTKYLIEVIKMDIWDRNPNGTIRKLNRDLKPPLPILPACHFNPLVYSHQHKNKSTNGCGNTQEREIYLI